MLSHPFIIIAFLVGCAAGAAGIKGFALVKAKWTAVKVKL